MSNARKYLALALTACRAKQYEEAGIFLAQASQDEDAEKLAEELGMSSIEEPATPELPEGVPSVSGDESDTEAEGETAQDAEPQEAEEEIDWGDETEEEGSEESVSTVTRRKTTSLYHIGKVLAASMSAGSAEDDEDEEEETQADPDFPGEALVPASFSSVKVKSLAVKSPVKLKV